MRMISKATATVLVLLCCGLDQDAWAGSVQTYLSLGDSIAFGETVFMNIRATYSDLLLPTATVASSRCMPITSDPVMKAWPNVINLGVDGETSSSFTSGIGRVPPAAGFTDASLAELNTHYTGLNPPTQAALLASTIASEAAAGHIIGNVSDLFALGSNDLFALALTSQNPAWLTCPMALATFKSNYESSPDDHPRQPPQQKKST